ncbi:MAG: hypothetical protein FWB88_03895 [Defluviitaleaceae bacterium]|nr:hypothetical protein [Defluviitaleaceae bacterium]MCL2239039.1 hypothetical protein [Defluviitaleaceae bacterium]
MKHRETVKDILANLVLFLLFVSVLAALHMIIYASLPWLYLLAAFPFFGLYLARKRVYVIPTFFVIHGLFLLLPLLFFRSVGELVPMMGIAVLSVIYSIRVRTKKEWRPEPRQAVMITASLAAVFFVSTTVFDVQVEGADRFFFAVTLMILASVLLVIQMENVDSRVEILSDRLRNSTPMKNILTANNILISGFLAFIIAVGMLSLFSPDIWRGVQWALIGLGMVVTLIVMFLMAHNLLWLRETTIPEEVYTHYFPVPFELNLVHDDLFDMMAEGMYRDYFILDEEGVAGVARLFYIQSVLLLAVLAVVLFFAGRAIIRAVIRNFFNKTGGDEDESLLPGDTLGRLKFMLGDLAAFLPGFRSTSRHPIRRAFAKKVNRHIKKGTPILPSDTPDAIANKIRPAENIDALTLQYENVRYGGTI